MNPEQLIDFCRKLIRTQSLSGQEAEAAALVLTEMRTLGYDQVWSDEYGNVIGCICAGRNKGAARVSGQGIAEPAAVGHRAILFDGHMDTVGVPSPERWSDSPFSATIKDGKLYGRGTADMKCALAAMIHGIAELIPHKERLTGDVYVAAVVFEETLEGVGLGKVLDHIKPKCVVLGEPSDFDLCIGQKGRAEIVIKTEGQNAHSATPERGINAVSHMVSLLPEIEKIEMKHCEHLGRGLLELTDIISAPYPGSSVIPNSCRATYDRRLVSNESEEDVLGPIQQIISRLAAENDSFKASAAIKHATETTYTGATLSEKRFFPGWVLPESAEPVQTALAACRALGHKTRINYYPFCTDGSESAGRRGIPTIGIGPAPFNMAHVVDEHILLEDIIKAKDIYREIARALLS